jgi:hypothetical protein
MDLERPLTPGERAALSAGLAEALEAAGAEPRIVAAPCAFARIASVWRGHLPILTLGQRIFWPAAYDDFSRPGREPHMAILQHELQHVLDFATGALSAWRYALVPRNWTYHYRLKPGARWRDFGAEQRASIVEDYWRIERGMKPPEPGLDAYRTLIPWAK